MNTALVTGKDYSITNLPKFWREIAEILDGEKRLAILDFPEGGSLVNPDPVIPFGIYPRTPRPQQHEPAHPAPPGSGQPGGQPGGQIGGHVTVDQFDPIEGTVYHEKRGQPFFPDIVRHMWEGAIPNIGFEKPPEWKIGIDYGTPPKWATGGGEGCDDGYYKGMAAALLYALNKENMMRAITDFIRDAYPHLRDRPDAMAAYARSMIASLPITQRDLAEEFGMFGKKGYKGGRESSYAWL